MKSGRWTWIAIAVSTLGGAAAGAVLIPLRDERPSGQSVVRTTAFDRAVSKSLRSLAGMAPSADGADDPLTGAVLGGLVGLSLLAPPMAVVVFLRGRSLFLQAGARSREELRRAVCQPTSRSSPPASGASFPNPGPAQPGAPSA